MEFMESPVAALAAAREKPFDVVVADMHMPEMSGVELLSHVTSMQPDTVGFILSGDVDDPSPSDAVPTAYPFITKPCSADLIRGTIQRALSALSPEACAQV